MKLYDLICEGYWSSYEYASAIARDGALLAECKVYEAERPIQSRPEGPVINGVQLWYCYGADCYFFEEVEE